MWRWRQTMRRGPVNINVSRGGVGWSINLGLFRYGITPYGRKYISVGIPRTGLYYMKYLGDPGQHAAPSSGQPTLPPLSTPPRPGPTGGHSRNKLILDEIRRLHRE